MQSKGYIVSSNITPFASTVSVVHDCQSLWTYKGILDFKPFEIIASEVSNSVMTALLFFDLNNKSSAGNAENKLNNPNQLFLYSSFYSAV